MSTKTKVQVVYRDHKNGQQLLTEFVEAETKEQAWQMVTRQFCQGGRYQGLPILDGYVTQNPDNIPF
jgi:hypothetical protein